MADSYTGSVSSVRDTFQKLTTADAFSKDIQFACYTKTPFMQAVGIEAFGVDAMKNLEAFNAAQPTGRIIEINAGGYAKRGYISPTTGTSFHVGKMENWGAEYVESGDEYAYSWMRLVNTQYIPIEDVEDNQGAAQLVDLKYLRMQIMKQQFVQDINYALLGNQSAPGYTSGAYGASVFATGPGSVYTDMPNLISVTQTRTVGGILATNSFWQNGYKAVTDVGGGGEMDRPLLLRRSWLDQLNDQMKHAEGSNDYLYVGTQGAFQIYDRLMYADTIQGGRGGAFASIAKYDAAGIEHFAFRSKPFVWDPAMSVPYGATAGTEAIYGLYVPKYFISLKDVANFKVSDWEPPREHDNPKTHVASINTRYCPGVTARRPHFVLYNIPACAD